MLKDELAKEGYNVENVEITVGTNNEAVGNGGAICSLINLETFLSIIISPLLCGCPAHNFRYYVQNLLVTSATTG